MQVFLCYCKYGEKRQKIKVLWYGRVFFLQVCPGLSSRLTFSKTKINGKSFWSGHDFARKIKQNNPLLFMSACLGIKTFKSSKQTTQTGRVKFKSLVMSSRKNPQRPRIDLNKRFLPRPNNTTA